MTRFAAAVAATALLLAGCGSGTTAEPERLGAGSPAAPASPAGPVAEPTPYTVPTSPATDPIPVIASSTVRPPGAGEASVPWMLIRLWDGGQRLAVQYTAGCDDEVDLAWEESPEQVLVQVLDDDADADCPWYRRTVHRARLELSAPLGDRPLLHAPTSTSQQDPRAEQSLAERFEDAPEWPGHPWFRDGREVTQFELALAAGPEHCDWQEAVFLSGDGLTAPRDERGRIWARDPKGVLEHFPRAQQEFRSPAVMPEDAAFTGYRQGAVEVWVAPTDEAAYVYLVNGDDRTDVERWVRGGGGCA